MYYYKKHNQDRLKAILDFKGVVNNTKVKNISKKIIRLTNKTQAETND